MSQAESLASHWVLLFFLALLNKYMLAWAANIASVERLSPRQEYIRRSWSEWTLWSACSRTCGGGVRMRTRICKIRIGKSVAFPSTCIGENTKYELCSVHSCSPHDKEFLEYQCSLRDGHIFGGKRVEEWIPYHFGKNPCELQCRSKDRSLVRSFGKVIDGTKCATTNRREPAICINGRCTAVDCAGQIGYDNKLDRCGICRGDNSTCVHIQDIHLKRARIKALPEGSKNHYDYDKITTIPAGATEIIVEENSEKNFLALMDHTGNYYVNGNWRIQSPGLFDVHGSEFVYNRTWDGSELLSASGPTRYDITVYVLGSGDIPTVYFEYWISSNSPFKPVLSFQTSTSANLNIYELDKTFKRQSSKYYPENNHIHGDLPTRKDFQGYKSYYHRNEILKSVPSWSIKRHGSHKNNLSKNLHKPRDISSKPNSVKVEVSSRLPYVDQKNIQRINKRNFRLEESRENKNIYTNARSHRQSKVVQPISYNKSYIYYTDYNQESPDRIIRKDYDPMHKTSFTVITPLEQKAFAQLEKPIDSFGRPNITLAYTRTSSYRLITAQPKFIQKDITKEHLKTEVKEDTLTKGLKVPKEENRKQNKKRRKTENSTCLCTKPKLQKKNFCESEFVLRVTILSIQKQEHSFRYEMNVKRSYKNKVPISSREYIWSANFCQCPKLRIGKEYIIMGHTGASPNRRESRLAINKDSFVRKYSKKRERTMQRLVRDQYSACNSLN